MLANIVLDPLDRELTRAGIAHVRYADDFVVLCASRADAQAALRRIARHLERRGLELHPDKTRIVRADAGVVFLGELLVPVRRRRLAGLAGWLRALLLRGAIAALALSWPGVAG